jgi:hypothetical protein
VHDLTAAWSTASSWSPVGRAVESKDLVTQTCIANHKAPLCLRNALSHEKYAPVQHWTTAVAATSPPNEPVSGLTDDLTSLVCVDFVPDTDPRVALRGQQRVVANKPLWICSDLKRTYVLLVQTGSLPYAGLVMFSNQATELLGDHWADRFCEYAFQLALRPARFWSLHRLPQGYALCKWRPIERFNFVTSPASSTTQSSTPRIRTHGRHPIAVSSGFGTRRCRTSLWRSTATLSKVKN